MKKAMICVIGLTSTFVLSAPAAIDSGGHNSGLRTSKLGIEGDHGVLFVRDFCSHGMQFIAVVQHKVGTNSGSGGVAVSQVLDESGRPMKCGVVQARPN